VTVVKLKEAYMLTDKLITFKRVKEAYGWLSNMSPHPVDAYRTAEAYFQASRFSDAQIRDLIRAEKSPMGAKMVAKKYIDQMVVVPRSEQDLLNMRCALLLKVQTHRHLMKELLDTGDRLIVEDVTSRPNESGLYWGMAIRFDETGLHWEGNNQLGKLWMELRQSLRGNRT